MVSNGSFLNFYSLLVWAIRFIGAIGILTATFASAQDVPGFENAPEDLVQGKTLKVLALNFSVEAPGSDWKWLKESHESERLHTFICYQSGENEAYVVTVSEESKPVILDENFVKKLVTTYDKDKATKGWTMAGQDYSESSIPLSGTYRIKINWTKPNKNLCIIAYAIGVGKRLYLLQSESFVSEESKSFKNLVSSYRTLNETKQGAELSSDGSAESEKVSLELISKVEPVYPEEARKARMQGVVELSCKIDEDGNVTVLKVLKSVHPLLDQAAADAVRQWKYKPPMKYGKPISVLSTATVRFTLSESQTQESQ